MPEEFKELVGVLKSIRGGLAMTVILLSGILVLLSCMGTWMSIKF